MSASITTRHRQHVPVIASVAVAGVIAGANVVGVAWHQSDDSASPNQAPALRTPTWRDYAKYGYYHGPKAPGAHSFQPTTAGGRIQDAR
jgi:hypothetical protein